MINKIKENIFQFHFQKFGSCVYLIILKNTKILIDSSSEENQEELIKDLKELRVKPEEIDVFLITHNHHDHLGNIELFLNAEIYDYKNIKDFHVNVIKVIKTPGHTSDGLSFLYKDVLFSGDTLFHNGIGRTDLPTSNPKQMQESLEKLKKLKYKILCPGHID